VTTVTENDTGDDVPPGHPGDGNGAAVFGRLFDDHARGLHGYLGARVGRSAADDLVAETFLIAYRDRARFDPGRGGVRPWLFGIATNLARHHQRSERRGLAAVARLGVVAEAHVDGPAGRVPDRVDAAADMGRLAGAVSALSTGDRDVLLLTAWAGLAAAEVDAALGIPVGTVRSRLHRVRHQLRGILHDRLDIEGGRR
jgi:RNA polymerase sigma-70 factor, ECF subfamily